VALRRRTTGLLVALICGALLAAGFAVTQQARAARGMEIALQDDAVLVSKLYFKKRNPYRYLRALGVTRLRVNVGWAYSMPKRQARRRRRPANVKWQFNAFDTTINQAAAHGIRVHLSLTGPAPAWASGARKIGPKKPVVRYYKRFARTAALHFAGRVDRYSIWNEPNWKGWLSPPSGALYRKLYLAGYGAIKAVDPDAKVLIGETSPYARRGFSVAPLAFLRRMACVNTSYRRVRRCPTLKADGYAQHPYDFRHAPNYRYPGADNVTMGTLSRLTRALDRLKRNGALRKNGGGRMPLYLTEFAYFAAGHRALPRRQRSRYLAQGFGIALRNPRVKSNLQYLLVQPPKRYKFSFFNTGLLSRRGKVSPQYRSLKRWYRQNRRRVKRPGDPIVLPPPNTP
jgi:hypothetical protein